MDMIFYSIKTILIDLLFTNWHSTIVFKKLYFFFKLVFKKSYFFFKFSLAIVVYQLNFIYFFAALYL